MTDKDTPQTPPAAAQDASVNLSQQLAESIVGKQNKTVRILVAVTAMFLGAGVGGAALSLFHFTPTASIILATAVAIAIVVTTEIFVTLRTADVAERSAEFATSAVKELEAEKKLIAKILSEHGPAIMKLESTMHSKLGKIKPEVRHTIVAARKILTALESRMTVLSKLPPLDSDEAALRQYAQLSGPLELPRKLQAEGKGSIEMPPIPKAEWESVLDHLMRQAEANLHSQ